MIARVGVGDELCRNLGDGVIRRRFVTAFRRRAGGAAERPPDHPRRGVGGRHQHDFRLQARTWLA